MKRKNLKLFLSLLITSTIVFATYLSVNQINKSKINTVIFCNSATAGNFLTGPKLEGTSKIFDKGDITVALLNNKCKDLSEVTLKILKKDKAGEYSYLSDFTTSVENNKNIINLGFNFSKNGDYKAQFINPKTNEVLGMGEINIRDL